MPVSWPAAERAAGSVVVGAESRCLRLRQVVKPFLFHPGVVQLVLFPVSIEHTPQRLQPLSLRDPAFAVCLQVLLAFTNDLLLRLDGGIETLQEVVVVLQVCGTHRRAR